MTGRQAGRQASREGWETGKKKGRQTRGYAGPAGRIRAETNGRKAYSRQAGKEGAHTSQRANDIREK